MWSRTLCMSSGRPLGCVKNIICQLISTNVFVNAYRKYLSKPKPRLSLTCEPITTTAQPPEILSVTPEYCRFRCVCYNRVWYRIKNPSAMCQTCVCAHLHFFTTFVFVSSRLYLMHFWDASSCVHTLGLPFLQVAVSQCAIDELIGCPLQREIIPRLMERQVTP